MSRRFKRTSVPRTRLAQKVAEILSSNKATDTGKNGFNCMNEGQRWLGLDDGFCPRDEDSQRFGLAHALESRKGTHANSNAIGADGFTDSVKDSQWKAKAVFETTSIRIRAVIAVGL
jgi:hypothetical protein